jgi:hypothetical protein
METAVILGLVTILVFTSYISYEMKKTPSFTPTRWVQTWLNPNIIALGLHFISTWVLVAITAYIAFFTSGQAYANFANTLFIVSVILVGFYNIIYGIMLVLWCATMPLTMVVERLNNGRK